MEEHAIIYITEIIHCAFNLFPKPVVFVFLIFWNIATLFNEVSSMVTRSYEWKRSTILAARTYRFTIKLISGQF